MKLLFVCSLNQWRSRTAETMLENSKAYQVRSAGTESNARVRLQPEHIDWADLIFVMEDRHIQRIHELYPDSVKDKKLLCLDIRAQREYMHPELIQELEEKLAKYINLDEI